MPIIVDGRAVAARIKQEARTAVAELAAQGSRVCLDALLIGDAGAGEIYARSQRSRCEEVGIEYRLHTLPAGVDNDAVRDAIRRLNNDPGVTGILLNLPLPPHIDAPAMQYYIDPYKDVEGVNPSNIGLLFYDSPINAPCTALAVMEILREVGCDPRGMNAVVVGQGNVAGKPISLFLLHKMATVTCCHIATRDLAAHTRQADLLICAVGKPGLIGKDHVRSGAIVIDVGINSVPAANGTKRIVGDVLFDEVADRCAVITPVPGGVGPVTVAMLLRSAADAARKQLATPRRLAGD